jgi:hypothetical protein
VSLDLEAIPVAGEGARRLTEDQGSNPLLQRLRERYERAEEDSTLDLDIPEYGGLLVARFRRLKGEELDGLTADVENLLEYNVAVLVEATVEVLARDKDGKLQSLSDDHPVLWDAELAGILGFEAERPARGAAEGFPRPGSDRPELRRSGELVDGQRPERA